MKPMNRFYGFCSCFAKDWCGIVVLGYLSIANIVDYAVDIINGVSETHIVVETIVSIIGFLLVLQMIRDNLRARNEILFVKKLLTASESQVTTVRLEADKWRNETSKLLAGLSTAIESKFSVWHLTPAEREIGFYLLKGLSLKEIAEVRKVSERTVRQQTLTIYEKSGVAGRAELSAFFLKDLLPGAKENIQTL